MQIWRIIVFNVEFCGVHGVSFFLQVCRKLATILTNCQNIPKSSANHQGITIFENKICENMAYTLPQHQQIGHKVIPYSRSVSTLSCLSLLLSAVLLFPAILCPCCPLCPSCCSLLSCVPSVLCVPAVLCSCCPVSLLFCVSLLLSPAVLCPCRVPRPGRMLPLPRPAAIWPGSPSRPPNTQTLSPGDCPQSWGLSSGLGTVLRPVLARHTLGCVLPRRTQLQGPVTVSLVLHSAPTLGLRSLIEGLLIG